MSPGQPPSGPGQEAREGLESGAGARLDELVDVVDALLADPGGCAWNRAQTAESLVTYLLEETYELVEAIEVGTSADRREELGDVLYQVVLHSALAARASSGAFDLGDVIREASEKAVRRHPHVFGVDRADDVDEIVRLWSAAKAREKSRRASAYDGVPAGLAALARAQKLDARRAATGAPRPDEVGAGTGAAPPDLELTWGRALLAQVDEATDRGIDAERALRAAVREREDALRRVEPPRRDEARRRDEAPATSGAEQVPPQPE